MLNKLIYSMLIQITMETKKNKKVLIAVFISFSVGFLAATIMHDSYGHKYENNNGVTSEMAENHGHSDGHEMHETKDADAQNAPEVSIQVTEDKEAGYNLALKIKNFKFTPENASSDHVNGTGHAHVYIDGKKISRLYSPNYYIGELPKGEHQIRVTLNTNDHKDYAVDGSMIEDTLTVVAE